jgi:hypothetical protein
MSRWIQNYENHAFQNIWGQLIELKEDITVDDQSVSTSVQEVARLIKVISYIQGLLEACDPELIPLNTWDNFHSQCNSCLAQINNYQSNRNIGHINKANSHVDNLLSYIRPYIVSSGTAARSASASFTHYSKTIDNHLESFNKKSSSVITNIDSLYTQASSSVEEINSMKEEIDEFNTKILVGYEDEESYKDQFNDLLEAIQEMHEKIVEYNIELNIGTEEELPIVKEISEARASIMSIDLSMDQIQTDNDSKLKELNKFYIRIFGNMDEETNEREGGLKQELNDKLERLESFKTLQELKYNTLNKEIESLLPGANSAGLATAYLDLKESFDAPIKNYGRMFYLSIILLFIVAAFTVIDTISWTSIKLTNIESFTNFFANFIFKLPLILPILWLALFASKRRSESSRLQQEYAHKEALAKSYINFKKQIVELDSADPELMKKLLESTINTVTFNASSTLDKKHGDNMPMQEIVDKVLTKVSNTKT